jgi:hypothetical protein
MYDEYGEFRGHVLINQRMAGSLLRYTWHEAGSW